MVPQKHLTATSLPADVIAEVNIACEARFFEANDVFVFVRFHLATGLCTKVLFIHTGL
jgi:hypothetical protein